MAKRVLGLFAKLPEPGRVKTRLVPPLTPASAARLYEAMLLDVLDLHAGLDVERVLWFTPADSRPWFERQARGRYRLEAQRGDGLAARMTALFALHASEGFERMVLRGTDSPTLPSERIDAAFTALERSDLVVCPDRDGGYNLIGLREPQPELFALEMSTASVLEQTLARARSLDLEVSLLPAHHDVDTAEDLARLESEVRAEHTPRTLRFLRATAGPTPGVR
ncbi:MAG: TIGR04282 family arsenosugar biosynthesis glycosyltransferase [Myxococcota bacterium]